MNLRINSDYSLHSQSITNKTQSFTISLFPSEALPVSDGFSTHNQEFKTAHTASGICQTKSATCC